jgi:D-glycero-alpha-D-manno-heptose-7-phosphate kinase
MRAGASAGKVSGAGGGGVVALFVEPARRAAVERELGRFQGTTVECRLTTSGVHAWPV